MSATIGFFSMVFSKLLERNIIKYNFGYFSVCIPPCSRAGLTGPCSTRWGRSTGDRSQHDAVSEEQDLNWPQRQSSLLHKALIMNILLF